MSNRRPARSAQGRSTPSRLTQAGSLDSSLKPSRPRRHDGSQQAGEGDADRPKRGGTFAKLFALPGLGGGQPPLSPSGSGQAGPANGVLPLVYPSSDQQEKICSAIGLSLKVGLSLVAAVSLVRLAGAYQERLDRNGEITAILAIEQAKLNKAEDRFDRLFATGGEQRLIREQDQWIAPDRLRIVWEHSSGLPTVEPPAVKAIKALVHP